MTITINGTNDQLTIGSTFFNSSHPQGGSTTEVDVTILLNCSTTAVYEVTFTAADPEISTDPDQLVLTPSDLGMTDNFLDGVYSFSLESTSSNGPVSFDDECHVNDQDLKCEVAAYKIDNPKTDIHIIHYMLTNIADCSCDCQVLCDLYTCITDTLGITSSSISTSNLTNCGCND